MGIEGGGISILVFENSDEFVIGTFFGKRMAVYGRHYIGDV